MSTPCCKPLPSKRVLAFVHSMLTVHKCISSRMLVKVPPMNSHQSKAGDFHLSGSRGVQPKSISVATMPDMEPCTSLQRHLVNRSVEWTRFHAFRTCWCSSLFSSQKRSHQEKMQRRTWMAGLCCCPIPISIAMTEQAWWPPHPNLQLLSLEIVSNPWATDHTAPLSRQQQAKCLWCRA